MNAISNENGGMTPPLFFARAIDKINLHNKIDAIKEVTRWHEDRHTPILALLDQNGKILYPQNEIEPENWDNIEKPQVPYGFRYISKNKIEERPWFAMGPKPPSMRDTLVRLEGEPTQYLLIRAPMMGPPPGEENGFKFFPFVVLGSLMMSLLLGVGTTMSIIYNGVKGGVSQADKVISELQKGNLKARFSITRRDEFGKAMMRFNTMASEIEKLVTNLKEVDQARTRLLQELAHDLRTPIASLKNLMESLSQNRERFSIEIQTEMTELALKEIHYFERLVEDLLLLAQIKDPSVQPQYPVVIISELLIETAENISLRYQNQELPIKFNFETSGDAVELSVDLHLITRLFRNALENSFSFAKSEVKISVQTNDRGFVNILIDDDGPGFSEEALSSFGKRKVTRKLENKPYGRLSVGLGSVVMRSIAYSFGGEVKPLNRVQEGNIVGGRVAILLPR